MEEKESLKVYLEEECGYRFWLWEPGMDAEELVKFWEAIPTMGPYFKDIKTLPGKMRQLSWLTDDIPDQTTVWRAHIHTDDNSLLIYPGGGSCAFHKGSKV